MSFDAESNAEELVLYADNESKLYPKKKMIQANLKKKKDAGKYDKKLAVVLWEYFAEDAARMYAKDITLDAKMWSKLFPPGVRKRAAEKWARSFEANGFEVGSI